MNINNLYAHEAVKEFERRGRKAKRIAKLLKSLPSKGNMKPKNKKCQNCMSPAHPKSRFCDDCFVKFNKF